MKKYKIPVVLYESEEQAIPYIEVEQGDDMPPTLFIQEYKHTGDFEPGEDGEEQPIVDMVMHMFVDMDFLSKKLNAELYDKVRTSIGLQPVKKARQEGQKILDRVYSKVNDRVGEALSQKEQVKSDLAEKLNKKLNERFFESEETTEEE